MEGIGKARCGIDRLRRGPAEGIPPLAMYDSRGVQIDSICYGARGRHGVPEHEKPRLYPPSARARPDDLSWYANIPVPTSYMAYRSDFDFVGCYDHGRQAGDDDG